MTFKTESGSVYEVDHAKSRVRRISGTHAPTSSQGPDGEWREFHIAFVELGYPAYFEWIPHSRKGTITSLVKEIQPDADENTNPS